MTDRPILFSAPMVRALLAGRKTQTRRLLKLPSWAAQPPEFEEDEQGVAAICAKTGCFALLPTPLIGDRLWVKETWSHSGHGVWTIADARRQISGAPIYRATANADPGIKWFPSIFMPREFSRLKLTVTNVRVERLQDCSRDDAVAEGVQRVGGGTLRWENWSGAEGQSAPDPVAAYALLWNSINGPGAWEANPWVVALTFEVGKGKIDA